MSPSPEARREFALHEAVESWGRPEPEVGQDVESHAQLVTFLAATFAGFLADGTVHDTPNALGDTQPDMPPEAEPQPHAPFDPANPLASLTEWAQRMREAPNVVAAAAAWVDEAHENNQSGPENWRNWADDKDIRLINAVRIYRGQEPIDQ